MQELNVTNIIENDKKLSVIILNQPLNLIILKNIWTNAPLSICADGGANRLYDVDEKKELIPDYIIGDMDSVRKEVKEYYQSKGVKIIIDKDKNATDLMKSLRIIAIHSLLLLTNQSYEKDKVKNIDTVVLGGTGGRLDHEFHTIHMMYWLYNSSKKLLLTNDYNKLAKEVYDYTYNTKKLLQHSKSLDFSNLPNFRLRLWTLTDDSLTFLLPPGESSIKLSKKWFGPTCGLLPFNGSTTIYYTKGLHWDVENWETSVNTKVSTSNWLDSSTVNVSVADSIVFTVEINLNNF